VTYLSTNTNVATVSANGTVTVINSTGNTTIKAVFAGDNTYNPKEVSYELTVLAPDPTVNYYNFAKNYQQLENPEFTSVIVDDADHILYGKRTDGTIYNSNLSTSETMTVDDVTQPVVVICAALKDKTAEELAANGVPEVTPESGGSGDEPVNSGENTGE
jgi:predicted membrane-bound mannosyltransferase